MKRMGTMGMRMMGMKIRMMRMEIPIGRSMELPTGMPV